MEKLFLILLFTTISLLSSQDISAQSSATLNLKKQLSSTKNDTTRVKLYNELGFEYIFSMPDTAEIYIDKALQMAEKIKFEKGIAQHYNMKGILYRTQGYYPDAIDFHLKSLQLYENINDPIGIADNYINMGLVYFNQEDYDQAIEYYQKCLAIKRKSSDRLGVAFAMKDIGDIYVKKENYPKAIDYYIKILEYNKTLNTETKERADIAVFRSLGIVYELQKDYEKAVKYLNKALTYYQAVKDQHGEMEAFNHLAKIYQEMGEENKAFQLYNQAKSIGEKNNIKMSLKSTYQGLSQSYAQKGDFTKAFKALQKYVVLQDSLFSVENTEKMANLQKSFQNKKKQIEIELLKKETKLKEEQNRLQNISIYALLIGISLILVIAFILLRNNRKKQKINLILQNQKQAIEQANLELARKNERITSSIKYAKRIQTAVLPFEEKFERALNEHFILFKPKDIVSGDFYWFQEFSSSEDVKSLNKKMLLAVADCTGHGVPGAFMSLIGSALLTEIVNMRKITEPAKVLKELHNYIQLSLNQKQKGDDGMDIGICYIKELDENHKKITYAGAKRPLYYIAKGSKQLEILKGDRKSLGGAFNQVGQFTNKVLTLKNESLIYLSSDGYADQNNENRKKIGEKQLTKTLLANHHLPLSEQKKALENTLAQHQQGSLQRDDILVFGLKL